MGVASQALTSRYHSSEHTEVSNSLVVVTVLAAAVHHSLVGLFSGDSGHSSSHVEGMYLGPQVQMAGLPSLGQQSSAVVARLIVTDWLRPSGHRLVPG